MGALLKEIEVYWTNRAEGYSHVNCQELEAGQNEVWINEIKKHIPQKHELKVLDIGSGPGFFSIILSNEGFNVTAIDYTEAMINEAKINAGPLKEKIDFIQMDAQNLEFNDETFDVVISRNLTWNLENPAKAYGEWTRVLKKGGVLLNFDANWYRYLYDNDLKEAYEVDRKTTQVNGIEDYYTCTDIDAMENIAKKVPLSQAMRPMWDKEVLSNCGIGDIYTDENVWKNVWMDVEKLNCASTPMFLVRGIK